MPRIPVPGVGGEVPGLCARERLSFVDLRTSFADVPPSGLRVNRLGGHPGEAATVRATAALLERFGFVWRSGAGAAPR